MYLIDELLRRHRFSHQIALQSVATQRCQEILLHDGFDSFRDYAQIQRMSQGDDGSNDGGIVCSICELAYEATINLQLTGRHTL